MNSDQEFKTKLLAKVERLKKIVRRLPRDLGNIALIFFMEQYRKEQTPSGEAWAPRKNNAGRRSQVLVKSGRLRKSIRLTNLTENSAKIGTDVKYARYHNEGTRKLPQRKFLGSSALLERRLKRHLKAKLLWELRK